MDTARLIVIVQEYPEVYNLRHPDYSNQQRRDNIWEEIGTRMNQTGKACKARWTRIRDNHRKALNLRKTKSGQAASKMKPPKFSQELAFLAPYLHDEEERQSNLSPVRAPVPTDSEDEEEDEETASYRSSTVEPPLPSPADSETQTSTSTSSKYGPDRKKPKKVEPTKSSVATVLHEYLVKKGNENATAHHLLPEPDPLSEFFLNMARTVKKFPPRDQVQIKAELFQKVNSVEMRLAREACSQQFSTDNPIVPTMAPHTQYHSNTASSTSRYASEDDSYERQQQEASNSFVNSFLTFPPS